MSSTRIVGDHRPDYHRLETFLDFQAFRGKSGEELVLAVYDFLTSERDGTYHFWPSKEADPRIRRTVTDGNRLLNCYGWMICGQCANLLYQLWKLAGLEARVHALPGHVLCEVFYNDSWHHIDVDMWNWFRTPDGHVASIEELAANPFKLIVENASVSKPCNLPDRSLEEYASMFEKGPSEQHPAWKIQAHDMDFVLRPGETLIRSEVDHNCYHFPPTWLESVERYSAEWHNGPKERYKPFRTVGNGRWIYSPQLGSGFQDFELGVWRNDGIEQCAEGLTGPGAVEFRIQSPYVFCGLQTIEGKMITAHDGVSLTVEGNGIATELLDCEQNWVKVAHGTGRVDITPQLTGRYDTIIRFSLEDGALLRSFTFDGMIMTAPKTIPLLLEGKNRMHVVTGDRYRLCTTPWTEIIDFRSTADLAAGAESTENAVEEDYVNGWKQLAPESEGPVVATYRFDAPAGRSFAWFYAMAQMREGTLEESCKHASLEWSMDRAAWHELDARQLCATGLGWDTNLDGHSPVLPPLSPTVWLRITSDTALTAMEFYGHLHADQTSDVKITHTWQDDAGEHSHSPVPSAVEYAINCAANPRKHAIEISCPSR